MNDEMKTKIVEGLNARAAVFGGGAYGTWKILSFQPTDSSETYEVEAESTQGVEKFEVGTDELLTDGAVSDDLVSGINGMIIMYEGWYDEDAE